MVTLADNDGVFQWVSPSVARMMGWQPEELIGRSGFEFAHPDDLTAARTKAAKVVAGSLMRNRVRIRCADGTYRWVRVTASPRTDRDGAVIGRVAGWLDVTAEVAAEEALAASQEHYRLLAEHASDVVIKSGLDGRIQWISPSVADVLGWAPDALMGQETASLVHPEELEEVRAARREALVHGGGWGSVELRVAKAGGSWLWMSGVGKVLVDEHGERMAGIDSLRDIQQEHDAREELRYIATHDTLTRTATREVALQRLRGLLGHPSHRGRHLGVLFIDVDNLKPINDCHGHAAGDAVLREVARRITQHVRTDDLVARFGGDEFVVILTSVDCQSDAETVAAHIQEALHPEVAIDGCSLQVGVSIGLAMTTPGREPSEALRNADKALYRAKHGGKSRTVTHVAS